MIEDAGPKKAHIPLSTLLYMAWRNIVSRKLRSFLTMFGVVIGIGSIAFLVSFGLGLQNVVTNQVIGDKSLKALDVSSPNSSIIKLDAAAVNKIKTYPHVSRTGLEYSFPTSISAQGGEVDSVIYGWDYTFQELTQLDLIEGRLLKKDEDPKSVVVSKSALKNLGLADQKKAVGQDLKVVVPLIGANLEKSELRDVFKIIGVVDSGNNSEIFVSSAVFDVAGVPTYKQMKVVSDDLANVTSLRKQIEGSGFQTNSPIDTLDQINQLFKFFNIILASFGGIGMIVAILGMFNTLTISLLERTKEIGLMITMGGRPKDMRRLFMFEAVMLSVVGAICGLLLSLLGATIVNKLLNQNAADRSTEMFNVFSMPFWLAVVLILFMIVVGLAVVYFPARRAQRINPIDALRRE